MMTDEQQIVVFELAGEHYGVNIDSVHEIIRMQEITEIPRTPDFIEGVINLRGKIIPVLDLRKRFGLSQMEHGKNTRIMVAEIGENVVGMIVDGVSEVLRISKDSIEPPSPLVASSIDTDYIMGIAKVSDDLIIMLDLQKVLTKTEKASLMKTVDREAIAVV